MIPWEKPNFLISLGITEILGFSELSVYTEVVQLKTYLQHFELCLFANIEKVMKFYNLGDKAFETDLSSSALSQNIKACFITRLMIIDQLVLQIVLTLKSI